MMAVDSVDALADRAYEAAFVPEHWPAVLDSMKSLTDAVGVVMFTTNLQRVSRWTASNGFQQTMSDWVEGGWQAKNQRTQRLFDLQYAGFVVDRDVFTEEELADDRESVEFLRPRGLGMSAGTLIPMPTGDVVVFSVERAGNSSSAWRDTVQQLDTVRPHLARAGAVAARLGLDRARASAETFAHLGLPAACLDHGGRLVAANSLFDGLVPAVFQDRTGRLTLVDRPADRLLAGLIQAPPGRSAGGIASIPLAAQEGQPPRVVHVLPVRGDARDIFSRVAWICVVMTVRPHEVPGAEVLQGLFDLTPAEARVARAIAMTKTVDQLAASLNLSRETIRGQLKSVLQKTGTNRQAELAALLAGAALPRRE